MSASSPLPVDVTAHPLVRIAADLSLMAWEQMSVWRGRFAADLDASVIGTKTSPNDLVTQADAEIESLVRGYLAAVRPRDLMVGEEGTEATDPTEVFDRDFLRRLNAFDPVTGLLAAPGPAAGGESDRHDGVGTDGLEWHVDPIDGTVNFVRGIEHYAFSVGVHRPAGTGGAVDGEGPTAAGSASGTASGTGVGDGTASGAGDGDWLLGLVASPGLDATWVAVRGQGAFRLEGRLLDRMPEPDAVGAGVPARRLHGAPAGLSGRLLATGFAYAGADRGRQLAGLPELMAGYDDIRRCGSAAIDLCMVAEGRVSCYAERGLGVYDYAGGALVAEESGAFVHRGGTGGPTVAADSAAELARLVAVV